MPQFFGLTLAGGTHTHSLSVLYHILGGIASRIVDITRDFWHFSGQIDVLKWGMTFTFPHFYIREDVAERRHRYGDGLLLVWYVCYGDLHCTTAFPA